METTMNFRNFPKSFRQIAAGVLVAALALSFGGLSAGVAQAEVNKPQEIANHFADIKSMTGDFVQFGPRGEQTGGKFYLDRPGKIRFDYDAPSPMRVISDGQALVVGNRKLATWDLYPLSKTPLAVLLGDKIDLTGKKVISVKEEDDLVTIVMGDKTLFGDATITMMFDPKTDDLRQWTITDLQGKETSVMIYNVQSGVKFADTVFKIPYDQVKAKK
jgi:outer membrane lipoprotein-sorting protein